MNWLVRWWVERQLKKEVSMSFVQGHKTWFIAVASFLAYALAWPELTQYVSAQHIAEGTSLAMLVLRLLTTGPIFGSPTPPPSVTPKVGAAVALGLLLAVSSPAQAADLQYLTLTPSLSTGLTSNFRGGTPTGGSVLGHLNLANYGVSKEAMGPDGKATTVRQPYVALDLAGGVAATNQQAANNSLGLPLGGCLVGYDLVSACIVTDPRNNWAASWHVGLNPLKAPAALMQFWGNLTQ